MKRLFATSTIAAAAVAATMVVPSGAGAFAANPCLDPVERRTLNCPDLVMKRPYGLDLDYTAQPGRVVLRAGNSIDSVGRGPAELHGVRTRRYFMKGRQRIYRRGGGRLGITTGARLFFKYVPRQRRYWKFHRAAAFQLWRIDSEGRRTDLVLRGPKISYCLRDLDHTRRRLARSPATRVYPACSTDSGERRVTIGTSVGWSDVYPPSYPEQWIDVTGLRGCFAFRHVADPANGIYESNERNNSATTIVRLPFRDGRQTCPGGRVEGSDPEPTPDPY